MRILVVEARLAMRRIIMQSLQAIGFTDALEATTGTEAASMVEQVRTVRAITAPGKPAAKEVREAPVRIVLLADNIPGEDCEQTVDDLLEEDASLHIILFTEDIEFRKRAVSYYEGRVAACLVKPLTNEILREALEFAAVIMRKLGDDDDPRCQMLTGEFEWDRGVLKHRPLRENWYLECTGTIKVAEHSLKFKAVYHLRDGDEGKYKAHWARGGRVCGPVLLTDVHGRQAGAQSGGHVRYVDQGSGPLMAIPKVRVTEALRDLHNVVRDRISQQDAYVAFLARRVRYLRDKWEAAVSGWEALAALCKEKKEAAERVLVAEDLCEAWSKQDEYLCQSVLETLQRPSGDPDRWD